jgi:hypothetical protein
MSWLANPAVTAWIQAIGSLLAIAAVFLIERIERRREQQRFKREAEVRAEHLAVALTAYMVDLQQQVGQIRRRLNATKADDNPGASLEQFEIRIAPVIEQAWDRFGELGPVLGAALVEVLARAGKYQQALSGRTFSVQERQTLKADVERIEVLLDKTIVPGLEKVRDRFIKASVSPA